MTTVSDGSGLSTLASHSQSDHQVGRCKPSSYKSVLQATDKRDKKIVSVYARLFRLIIQRRGGGGGASTGRRAHRASGDLRLNSPGRRPPTVTLSTSSRRRCERRPPEQGGDEYGEKSGGFRNFAPTFWSSAAVGFVHHAWPVVVTHQCIADRKRMSCQLLRRQLSWAIITCQPGPAFPCESTYVTLCELIDGQIDIDNYRWEAGPPFPKLINLQSEVLDQGQIQIQIWRASR